MNFKILITAVVSIVHAAANMKTSGEFYDNFEAETYFTESSDDDLFSFTTHDSIVYIDSDDEAEEKDIPKLNSTATSSKILNLTDDLIFKIGEYLACPQKQFGFLNKQLSDLFLHKRPYRYFLAKRLNFNKMAVSYRSDNGLIFFEKLAYIKSPIHLYKSIMTALKQDQIYKGKTRKIAKYAGILQKSVLIDENLDLNESVFHDNYNETYRSDSESDSESTNSYETGSIISFHGAAKYIDNIGPEYVEILINSESYKELINYLALYPKSQNMFAFSLKNPKVGLILMQQLLTMNRNLFSKLKKMLGNDESFDFNSASESLFNRFLVALVDEERIVEFIVISIVAGVPLDWFKSKIIAFNDYLMLKFFKNIFTIFTKGDEERIFDDLTTILTEIPINDGSIRFYSLLNAIRFGNLNDSNHVLLECDEMDLQIESVSSVFIAAALAKKGSIVKEIYKEYRNFEGKLSFIKSIVTKSRAFNSIVYLLEIVSDSEEFVITSYNRLFDTFMLYYNIVGFETVNSTMQFYLKLKDLMKERGLPDIFEYYIQSNCKDSVNSKFSKSQRKFLMRAVNRYFFANDFHNESSILRILKNLSKFDRPRSFLRKIGNDLPIFASCKVMSTISESEDILSIIRNYDIEFEIKNDHENLKYLFNKSICNLKGILDVPVRSLSFLVTANQFRNYEEFLEQSISKLFIKEAYYFVNEFRKSRFFTYRFALHYWFNGPNRDKMRDLWWHDAKLMKMFVKELDIEDAKYLLNLRTRV